MPHLSFATLAHTRHGNTLMVAGAMLALGVVAGATMRSSLMPKATAPVELAHAATNEPAPSATPMTRRLDPSLVYPPRCCASSTATRSRRGCGCGRGSTLTPRCGCAASMRRSCMRVCDDERIKAEAARAALQTILAEGGIAISQVGVDKYDGRRRGSWC